MEHVLSTLIATLLFNIAFAHNAVCSYAIDTSSSYLVRQADEYLNSYQYQAAEKLYDEYLHNILKRESLGLDNCYVSANKEILGHTLYNHAYNSFFMGNPKKGLYLLSLSAKCGNTWARQDYALLSDIETSMADLKISDKIINQYKKILKASDFKFQISDTTTKDIPKNFWRDFSSQNNSIRKLQIALSKKRRPKMLSKAMYEILLERDLMADQLKNKCKPYKPGVTEEELTSMLEGESSDLYELRIYPASEINAFATPYAQIYLTSGLTYRYHSMNHLLLGVCAHEMTHVKGYHSLIGLWEQYKKKHRTEITARIIASLYAASMAASSIYSASSGVTNQAYHGNIATNATNLYSAIAGSSFYFKFKYSRKQELEADLIAYRFCEAIGLGGYAYIMSLQLLVEDDLYLKHDKTDNHPTLAYRIAFLKWLYENERGN